MRRKLVKMKFGKTIKIFLIDGESNGRMSCELSNWSGKAYKIPRIKIKDCSDRNDLNNTGVYLLFGKDEIGLLPNWFRGCWNGYKVWTLNNHQWIYAVEPITTHCEQWEDGIIPIEIDRNKKGYVLIRYSVHTGDDIIIKTKSVPIK